MLIAKAPIIIKNTQYFPGDELPENSGLKEAWLDSGAAYERKNNEEPKPKAKRVSAKAGVPGKAETNAEAEENLVGIVPANPKRKRK